MLRCSLSYAKIHFSPIPSKYLFPVLSVPASIVLPVVFYSWILISRILRIISPCHFVFLSPSKIKKTFFFFFYPHTLTIRLKRPVYRGFSGEGKCEGKLSSLTPPSHPHGWILLHFVTKFTLILPVNKLKKRYQKSIAPWYQQYSIGIPTVLHSYTDSIS